MDNNDEIKFKEKRVEAKDIKNKNDEIKSKKMFLCLNIYFTLFQPFS